MPSEIRDDAVWITWERQTRNQSASQYFGVPLFELTTSGTTRAARYFRCAAQTISIIRNKKPRILFAQNPSIVLATLVVAIKKIARYKVVIDAHNAGIHGPENASALISRFNRLVIKQADAVIVTNSALAEHVRSLGGRPIVLPDPLPRLSTTKTGDADKTTQSQTSRKKALCITSWSDDEPLSELLTATQRFSGEVEFYFSGNFKKASNLLPEKIPENVKLMGFVDEGTFQKQLFSSDFCIDLTKRFDCMVCGAYESISAKKPVLLSNSPVQKNYFRKGAVFCENTASGIEAGIQEMVANLAHYQQGASKLKSEILEQEDKQRPLVLSAILDL